MANSKILIVGLGSIGRRHAGIARELFPNARIAALRHKVVEGFVPGSIDDVFFTIKDAIAFGPNIAVICNPSSLHITIASELAAAGVHLLIEKPLSNSVSEAQLFTELVSSFNSEIMVGYNLRFLDSLIAFRKMLDDGIVGRICSFRVEVGQNLGLWRDGSDYRSGPSGSHMLGGGVLFELSHELDYIEWIFGEIQWVLSDVGKKSSLEIDVEDMANVLMQTKKWGECVDEVSGTLTMDFFRNDSTRCITAIGENGTLIWDCISSQVRIFRRQSKVFEILQFNSNEVDTSYRQEWKYFMECVESKEKKRFSLHSGLRTLRIIDAIRRASNTGSKVFL